MLPPKLQPGDTIGIVSPSHIAEADRYAGILDGLERLGYQVKPGANLYKNTYGYLASEQERADDINTMAKDQDVQMVFFGGGYGALEVLPLLDYEAIGQNPKIYASYSDGTSILNAIYSKTGLTTFYGQSPGEYADLRHYNYTQLIDRIAEQNAGFWAKNSRWQPLHPGRAEGILLGGYTWNFALSLGGEYLSYDEGKQYILFLEDHESFSNVSAVSMALSHIEQSPFIRRVSGLLFGHYAKELPAELAARLTRFGEKHGVPVIYCDDFGHGTNHGILPIGQEALLDANANMLYLRP